MAPREVVAELDSLAPRLRQLTALARQLAFVTPRDGRWEPSFGALQGWARELVWAAAG